MRALTVSVAALIAMTALPAAAAAQDSRSPPSPEPGIQDRAQKAIDAESGRAGKQDPLPETGPQSAGGAFVDGRLNVPGAPADSQTVPAKFSARNDALDKRPILGFELGLTDAQRRSIVAAAHDAKAPVAVSNARLTEELPPQLPLQTLPNAVIAAAPNLKDLKYVRLADRILLVYAPNRFVVGEIRG